MMMVIVMMMMIIFCLPFSNSIDIIVEVVEIYWCSNCCPYQSSWYSTQIIVLQHFVTMKLSHSFNVPHLLTTITKKCVLIELSSIALDFTFTDDNYHNFEFSIRMIADKYDRLEDCMVSYDYDKHTIS